MNNAHKLFETKDASLNISVSFDLVRWLVGLAYQDSMMNSELRMKMIVLHLGPACFAFTRFSIVLHAAGGSRRAERSPTRQSGKNPRKIRP